MLSNDLDPQSVVISNELVQCVSGARHKYHDYVGQLKDEEKQLKLDQQKSTLLKEIDGPIPKRDQLDTIYASLKANYVKFTEMAESKMNLSYISKAIALKRKAADVNNDIKKMEETLSMLQEKRKKL